MNLFIKAILFPIFAATLLPAQGEYFRNAQTGLAIARAYSFSREENIRGTAIGASFFRRLDISMIVEDGNPFFYKGNSYSVAVHLIHHDEPKTWRQYTSLSASFSIFGRLYRSLSITPYIKFPIHNDIKGIFNITWSAVARVENEKFINAYSTGIDIQDEIIDNIFSVVSGSMAFSKTYPAFGVSATLAVAVL